MSHFTRMRIQNFQNVTLFDEELSPGLNIFTGKSRAGKSARSIRPFRWLYSNRPLGEKIKAFMRRGADFMSVEVWTSDGAHIQRYLSSKDSYYQLQLPEQEEPCKFRAFGQNPPEEILKALNLSDINFQDQHSPHYLLSMNSSEVARELNDIANLSDIDNAFSAINGRLNKDRAAKKTSKALKEDLEKKLEKYNGLEDLEQTSIMLENLEIQRQIRLREVHTYQGAAQSYTQKQQDLLQYKDVEELRGHLVALDQAEMDREELMLEARHLKSVAEKYKQRLQELAQYEDFSKALREWNRLNNAWANSREKILSLREEANTLRNTANRHVEAKQTYETLKDTFEFHHDEFHKNMPPICPLCGGAIK